MEKNSIGSDENINIDDYYVRTREERIQRHEFAYSNVLTTRERIAIFRNEFSEFTSLDDD